MPYESYCGNGYGGGGVVVGMCIVGWCWDVDGGNVWKLVWMCGFVMCVYIGMCCNCGRYRLGARVVGLAWGDICGINLRLYLVFSMEEAKP